MTTHQSFRLAEFKALSPEATETGEFEAIVSVFNNIDLQGDRVVPGAFAKSLDRWNNSGDTIPVIYSHQWDNIDAYIGEVIKAEELMPGDERLPDRIRGLGGLYVHGRFDLEEESARKMYRLLRKRRIKEFSFAYDIEDSRVDDDGVNELLVLDVIEVGPTLKGANPRTELLSVKSDQAVRELVEEKMKAVAEQVTASIVEQLKELSVEAGEKASQAAPVDGNSPEPARPMTPADVLLRTDMLEAL